MKKYFIMEVTTRRFDIFSKVINNQLLLTEASSLLGLSYRHTISLFNNFKLSGIDALVKKYNNSDKNIKVDNFMEKNY